MTFWKRQNCQISKKISGCQGLGSRDEYWITKYIRRSFLLNTKVNIWVSFLPVFFFQCRFI